MDLNNLKPFVWRKKYEALGVKVDEKEIEAEARRKAEENKVELEKIRERQRKRELDYQQKLSDGEFLSRQREAAHHEHWEQQEDDFVLKQHLQRSKIRIRDGRAKPIDRFAHYIDTFGAQHDKPKEGVYLLEEQVDLSNSLVELKNPCDWFNGLRAADLEALLPDIEIYMNADCKENQTYWTDLLDIANDELSKLQALHEKSDINSAVLQTMISLFSDKSIEQLDELEDEIVDKLEDDDPSIDTFFYKVALSRLRAHRARARLTSRHKENMIEEEKQEEEPETAVSTELDIDHKDEELTNICMEEYRNGGYSPKMYRKNELESGVVVVESKSQIESLKMMRDYVSNQSDGSNFKCEINLKTSYSWADKYQPRKPRYFNRIHTGFEWNKYNQTHYDVDNPPPKVVQGYKFNIFYPDLIDKSKAPQFSITPCKDDRDFCVIRFSAGPPYEDIAFKIVNREWNNSHKSGYKCQFSNNTLQLWFQFKRYRYRR